MDWTEKNLPYVGITEVDNDIWLVSFMDYDLGFFDNEVNRVEPAGENPFAPKVLPMSPEWTGKGGGTPSRTRTCDPLLRRQMLYPPELWAHILCFHRLSRIIEYH